MASITKIKKIVGNTESLHEKKKRTRRQRRSSDPDEMISSMTTKIRKRNFKLSMKTDIDKKRNFKKTTKKKADSLELALKDKKLTPDEIEKRKLLETKIINNKDSQNNKTISEHLNEKGFSYESQAIMISVKCVNKYIINYLAALFLEESEYPFKGNHIDNTVIRIISNKWETIKEILKKTEPLITAEEAVLSLMKSQGISYENVIIFLNLFSSNKDSFKNDKMLNRKYQNYENVKYPFDDSEFIRDILEIAKGGHASLKGFVQTFVKEDKKEYSDWEIINNHLWSSLIETKQTSHTLNRFIIRLNNERWMVTKQTNSHEDITKLTIVNEKNPTIEKTITINEATRKIYLLNEETKETEKELNETEIMIKHPDVSERIILKILKKCVRTFGGIKNKQALIECLSKPEQISKIEKDTLFNILKHKEGINLEIVESIKIIAKLVGIDGGARNKEAFIECLYEEKIELNNQKVSLYTFLTSKDGGNLTPKETIQILAKCIGQIGGSRNKEALIECFSKKEIHINGESKTLYEVLRSKEGGQLNKKEAIQTITTCVNHNGGAKNKEAFIECLIKPEIAFKNKKITLLEFIVDKDGADINPYEAIQIIIKCIGKGGGSKNKQALIESLTEEIIKLGDQKVTLFDFIKEQGDLKKQPLAVIHIIIRCISQHGGSKNKEALIECLCNKEIELDGEMVSLYTFLKSKTGEISTEKDIIEILVKCIAHNGGSKNKEALIKCFMEKDIILEDQKVTLYNFLKSEKGGKLSSLEATQTLIDCIRYTAGSKNIEEFKYYINGSPEKDEKENKSLYKIFLSGKMKEEDAIRLCLMFSNNRTTTDSKDAIKLFTDNKESKNGKTVIDILNDLNISTYKTIGSIITKIIGYTKSTAETKRNFFSRNCESLIDMFIKKEGFFIKKSIENPKWNETILGEKCIKACTLYTGNNIHKELKEREDLILEWIKEINPYYKLTMEGVDIITSVQNTEELKSIIELCRKEIELKKRTPINEDSCEESLKYTVKILTEFGINTVKALIKNKKFIIEWFDIKKLSHMVTNWWNNTSVDKSIEYYFQNKKEIELLMTDLSEKNSFLIYMGLSAMTKPQLIPLKVREIRTFLELTTNKKDNDLLRKPKDHLYPLYDIYTQLQEEDRNETYKKIIEATQKIFGSYQHFQCEYKDKFEKRDWRIFLSIIEKWDIEKDNLTQEELNLLIKIRYRMRMNIKIQWPSIDDLENCENGCKVINKTPYPNWVFAISVINEIKGFLEYECNVTEGKDSVTYENYNSIKEGLYKFNLFKVKLCKEGFIFLDEKRDSVEHFYKESGIIKEINEQDVDVETLKNKEDTKRKRKRKAQNEKLEIESKRIKKDTNKENYEETINVSRKRKQTNTIAELPLEKRAKEMTEKETLETLQKAEDEIEKEIEKIIENNPMLPRTEGQLMTPILEFENEENSFMPIMFFDCINTFWEEEEEEDPI